MTITERGEQVEGTYISCSGPWLRSSSNYQLESSFNKKRFYCADQNLFSMWGDWECSIFLDNFDDGPIKVVDFCVESTGPAQVDLTWGPATGGTALFVNAGSACEGAAAPGFLGDAGTPTVGGDADHFEFAGKAGERLRVLVDRDGTAGSVGEVASVEVTSRSGQPLAQKTGKLPITLDVVMADASAGFVVRSAGDKVANVFRGAYVLSVTPEGGKVGGRLLQPRTSVEP
jgi:hypothetical protein